MQFISYSIIACTTVTYAFISGSKLFEPMFEELSAIEVDKFSVMFSGKTDWHSVAL